MSKITKIIIGIIGVLFAGFIVLTILSYRLVNKSLPQEEGEIKIKGLKSEVKVYRDNYGIPHIFAENESDLMFTLGYVHSQDRLWQMDITRHAVEGRLSEIFGKITIEGDRFLRTLGFERMAKTMEQNLSSKSRELLEAYTSGVNAFIEDNIDKLPVEFILLGYKPEKWKITHSLGYARLMALRLNYSWNIDIVFGEIIDKVGEERAREIFPSYPKDKPIIVSKEMKKLTKLEFFNLDSEIQRILNVGNFSGGSNNWVISGAKSVTGKPILANDPHLKLESPSVWYEVHLVGGKLDVAGVSFAGVPGVVIGHNKSIAWGMTNIMLDDCDFYLEKINPDNSNQYLLDGKWRDMAVIIDTIRVKDSNSVIDTIRLTHRGPIISKIHKTLKDTKSSEAVSVRWTAFEPSDEAFAIYEVNTATNWEEFIKGVSKFTVPGQNFVYADTTGNIGYYAGGRIPIRNKGEGFLPMPGEFSQYDWKGFVPFEKNPSIFNPSKGYIATANNKLVDDSYPYYISIFWEDPARIERIEEMIKQKEKLSVRDIEKIQMDYLSLHAKRVVPYILNAFEKIPEKYKNIKNLEKIQLYMKNWNFVETSESISATIYNVFLQHLFENIYKNKIGKELYESYINVGNVPMRNVTELLQKETSWWFADSVGQRDGRRDDIILKSFLDAIATLVDTLGENVDNWQWGKLHKITFEHFLGAQKPLDMIFNIGPFSVGGSQITINKAEYPLNKPYNMTVGPSTRQIVDLSNVDNSQSVIFTGQSGQPTSPHYKDQTELWLNGLYHTVIMDKSKIENAGYKLLVMKPAE